MGYRENVQALCDELGILNPIEERDLKIRYLRFTNPDGLDKTIEATDMNRAGRLFFQKVAGSRASSMTCDDELRERGRVFFSERWGNLHSEMLQAFSKAACVHIGWKSQHG